MKKLLFISLFITFLFGQVYGQTLTLGVKAGPTVSGLLYSDSPKTGHRFGFSAGVSLLKPISDNKQLGVELIYDQRGYSDQIAFTNIEGAYAGILKFTFLFDYIALPCYVRFHSSKDVQWFLDLGVSPSYLISTRIESHSVDLNGNIGPLTKVKFDPYPFNLRRFDFSALVGGGVQFKIIDNTTIELNLRYTNGLISLYDKGLFGQYMLINSLNFSVGVNYRIK